MMSSEVFQPMQLKGEIMDLEFTLDTDHSAIANALARDVFSLAWKTGLCVYEIDDPALRDDPSVDENTRLRNRIAELESLVRELRGKPHPRWAESNFRDGDPNEKWHSRATKCVSLSKRNTQLPDELSRNGRALPSLLSPIKTEPATDVSPHLYRFSPSPAPSMRYHHTFQAPRSNSSSSFENDQRQSYTSSNGTTIPYHHHPPASPQYNGTHNPGSTPSSYSEGGGGNYSLSSSDEGHNYGDNFPGNTATPQAFCPCRTNPATGVAYISLSQQLQNCLNSLRQFSHHPPNTPCLLYRRIAELNSLLQSNNNSDASAPSYDSGTPSDELLTPLSASSGPGSFHPTGSPDVSPQEWNNMATAGYNPYFPLPPGDHHTVYTHVMS